MQDLQIASAARLDIGDNLLIDGNQPGYKQPWLATPPAPATSATYQASVRGSYNGVPLTVATGVDTAANSSAAVGYSSGAGLAALYNAGTFRGETFDNNDFVFFATLRGDANFDRKVDFNDLVVLASRYGTTTTYGYAGGNFDDPAANNAVDFNDLIPLAQNYNKVFSIAPAIVAVKAAPATAAKKSSVAASVLA